MTTISTIVLMIRRKAVTFLFDPIGIDAATFEFENVPVETAHFLARRVRLHPGPQALDVSQDRLEEKRFLNGQGIATARFAPVGSADELREAVAEIGVPAFLKTRRLGYDGKGQARLAKPSDADAAWIAIGQGPAILERKVAFAKELSVIAVRDGHGRIDSYAPGENIHTDQILHKTVVPARIDETVARSARKIAAQIAEALDYIGVLAVEFFLTEETDGRPAGLLVNEIAPRIHNSGHWTIDACLVSQFENHVRAVCGWPLGAMDRHSDAVMINLLGNEAEDWRRFAQDPNCAVHIYDKGPARAGRKMGHTTHIYPFGTLAARQADSSK